MTKDQRVPSHKPDRSRPIVGGRRKWRIAGAMIIYVRLRKKQLWGKSRKSAVGRGKQEAAIHMHDAWDRHALTSTLLLVGADSEKLSPFNGRES